LENAQDREKALRELPRDALENYVASLNQLGRITPKKLGYI